MYNQTTGKALFWGFLLIFVGSVFILNNLGLIEIELLSRHARGHTPGAGLVLFRRRVRGEAKRGWNAVRVDKVAQGPPGAFVACPPSERMLTGARVVNSW